MGNNKHSMRIAGHDLTIAKLAEHKTVYHLIGETKADFKLKTMAILHYEFRVGSFNQHLAFQFSDTPSTVHWLTTSAANNGSTKSCALENMFNSINAMDNESDDYLERKGVFAKLASMFQESFFKESGISLGLDDAIALYDLLYKMAVSAEKVADISPESLIWRCENSFGKSMLKEYKDIEDYDLIFGGWHASKKDEIDTTPFHLANPAIALAFVEDNVVAINEAANLASLESERLKKQLQQANKEKRLANQRLTEYLHSAVEDCSNELSGRTVEERIALSTAVDIAQKNLVDILKRSNENADKVIIIMNKYIERLNFNIALRHYSTEPIVNTIQ